MQACLREMCYVTNSQDTVHHPSSAPPRGPKQIARPIVSMVP